ncbi:ligase-associated DNA damage response DEXH box helicase [Enterovirga rhinocerotis]|uniref:ATP-dependent Lhr-like helicase n=1 Tax=Enterovirga rhinocerotis TaxID=1339210 RepID=A0A4R7C619_9HYPH|nr:ligase-associated DNA damage response DEXH box helicase [Enterovirga rhinocerotis]TDR93362.1 ATP-dependent Lhr-like helicase [Enterovirga rhinocerotis]
MARPLRRLPEPFAAWFAARGWAPRAHQLDLLAKAQAGRSVLLVAPTGAGKTLAGFLPSLVELAGAERSANGRAVAQRGLHTLYISPLKALAVDVARNLETPVREMDLAITVETRTGDTPPHKRKRQVERPPDILMTTPEQLALLLASRSAADLFGGLRRVVLDELHALVTSKRGDLLSLGLARLQALAPGLATIGLSATVREPDALRRYLVPQGEKGSGGLSDLVIVEGGAAPDIRLLTLPRDLPLAGHMGSLMLPAIYDLIREHKTTLVFTNTRFQAEYTFQELWRMNEETLPIAIHHGSLDVEQRRRVEAAMTAGKLKAVVCTATLDLGIDWGDVDLVINLGAPKGASRIMQRIGRANHRMDEPSKAYLAPTNRFEILECTAALDAVEAAAQDTPDPRRGGLDVLAQHVLGMACADPFAMEALYEEVRSAAPYADLTWEDFEQVVDFVATGGYALRAYERFAKILRGTDGLWRVRDGRVAQQYRLNAGTIVGGTMLKVRLVRQMRGKPGAVVPRGRVLGEVEEGFCEMMVAGDSFVFAGEVLRFETIFEDSVLVTRAAAADDPSIPSYAGSKFPLSTFLAERVRGLLAEPAEWDRLPMGAGPWLRHQQQRSLIPAPGELLVETFPREKRFYLVAYAFEGRLAHQTLGMLLTRRLERARLRPLGFVANDYGIAAWCLRDIGAHAAENPAFLDDLFGEDMLGDDLETWLDESAMMKRTFRDCAVIAGLIDRRHPGERKTGRQVTISTDLVYDVLRRHQPDHLLLRAARADAATGLLDVRRLGQMLGRIRGRIRHKPLDRVSPLAISLILEIGRERVFGEAADEILGEAEAMLIEEATA